MKIVCFSFEDFKSLVKPGDLVKFYYNQDYNFEYKGNPTNIFIALLKDLEIKNNPYSVITDFNDCFDINLFLIKATVNKITFLYENKLVYIDKLTLKENVFYSGNYIEFEKLN